LLGSLSLLLGLCRRGRRGRARIADLWKGTLGKDTSVESTSKQKALVAIAVQ